MTSQQQTAIEWGLVRKKERIRQKLAALPSMACAKESTNRKRVHLAAMLREIDKQLFELKQRALFPMNQRRSGHAT